MLGGPGGLWESQNWGAGSGKAALEEPSCVACTLQEHNDCPPCLHFYLKGRKSFHLLVHAPNAKAHDSQRQGRLKPGGQNSIQASSGGWHARPPVLEPPRVCAGREMELQAELSPGLQCRKLGFQAAVS